jgi:hypothetical protein
MMCVGVMLVVEKEEEELVVGEIFQAYAPIESYLLKESQPSGVLYFFYIQQKTTSPPFITRRHFALD